MRDRALRPMLALCTAILGVAALYAASAIFAPVAFALFVIAIAWPLQRALQARMPKLLAVLVTVVVTGIVVLALASLVIWGFGRAGQWLIANGARFQLLYGEARDWLDGHGFYAAGALAGHFDAAWLIRAFQQVSGRLNATLTFMVVTLVFVLLGLLEVDDTRRKLERLKGGELGGALLRAGADIAGKLQRYMLVRSLMSAATGLAVWAFASAAGLNLALEWGVMAFALNYIPFIGPLVATVLPTLFAVAQFGSWETAVLVFLGLNAIQFVLGSYLEPRIAGAALSISPFMVLFAVFFWSFLWGIPGAFIGVPILIALVTFCEQHSSTRWIADLVGGERPAKAEARVPSRLV